jgi:hypothetical protein
MDNLPAIGFSFSRKICENFAVLIYQHLLESEKLEMESELPNYEKDLAKEVKRIEEEIEKANKKKKSKLNEGEEKPDEQEEVDRTNKVEEKRRKIIEKHSFAMNSRILQEEDIQWWLKKLKKKYNDFDETHTLIKCLSKGIGIHHPGKIYK